MSKRVCPGIWRCICNEPLPMRTHDSSQVHAQSDPSHVAKRTLIVCFHRTAAPHTPPPPPPPPSPLLCRQDPHGGHEYINPTPPRCLRQAGCWRPRAGLRWPCWRCKRGDPPPQNMIHQPAPPPPSHTHVPRTVGTRRWPRASRVEAHGQHRAPPPPMRLPLGPASTGPGGRGCGTRRHPLLHFASPEHRERPPFPERKDGPALIERGGPRGGGGGGGLAAVPFQTARYPNQTFASAPPLPPSPASRSPSLGGLLPLVAAWGCRRRPSPCEGRGWGVTGGIR